MSLPKDKKKKKNIPCMKLQRRPGTMNRERKALVVFRSTFPDRCSVYTTVYMIPLDAQSSPSLEIRQEEGTNLQIQESILDGYKTKGGGGDGHALLIASFYFFSFPVSSLNILLTAIKT